MIVIEEIAVLEQDAGRGTVTSDTAKIGRFAFPVPTDNAIRVINIRTGRNDDCLIPTVPQNAVRHLNMNAVV